MARPPYPERPPPRQSWLFGPDSWLRIAIAGIVAGVVIAFVVALIAAAVTGSESGPLDPVPTATPEVRAAMGFEADMALPSAALSLLKSRDASTGSAWR